MVGQMYPLGTVRRRVIRRRARTGPVLLATLMLLAAGAAIGTGIKILTGDTCYRVMHETKENGQSVGRRSMSVPCL